MAQFTQYDSTDASAPTLSGTVGTLITVLDAVLVNGYGSKSPAGWTKPYSGTNKAAYRAGAGLLHYSRIQDDGPGVHGGREARLTNYITMSDVDTGTGQNPTNYNAAGYGYATIRKSASADSTTRTWRVFADNRTVYIFIQTGDVASRWHGFSFGEFYSNITYDSARTYVVGNIQEAGTTGDYNGLALHHKINQTSNCFSFCRGYTGVGAPVLGGMSGDRSVSPSSGLHLEGGVPWPNPIDGGVYLAPLYLYEQSNRVIRGTLRGFWHFCHAVSNVNDGDTFTGSGALSGKTFYVVKNTVLRSDGGGPGVYIIETSNTLDTN